MEDLISTVTFLLMICILLVPFFILNKINKGRLKYKFLLYFFISIIVTSFLSFLFAWSANTEDLMLLSHYGYNIDGMNQSEFYGNVQPENLERVNSLVTSVMGIGWPLKAIFGCVLFVPYVLFVYLVVFIFRKYFRKVT